MEEMQSSAKQDTHFKPRAHVFLSLMRALAERGDVESVGSLRSRMVAEAGGHVWAEDRAEADELYIEAAVIAGKVALVINRPISFHPKNIASLTVSSFCGCSWVKRNGR